MPVTKTSWLSKWNNSPTTSIRIPRKFKDEILEYAKALDSDEEPKTITALLLIDAYMNKKPTDKRGENLKYNTSPRWYHFNKFREWLKDNSN